MSEFGQTLFGNSSLARWALTPFIVLFLALMPVTTDPETPLQILVLLVLEVTGLALLAGFWLSQPWRRGAFRVVSAIVFLCYTVYLVHELTDLDATLPGEEQVDDTLPIEALLGFILIGLPCLLYAWRGRFTFWSKESLDDSLVERGAYEDRILRPDWEFYERHLRRPVPPALRELYSDRRLVTGQVLTLRDELDIGTFESLEECGLIEMPQENCDEVIAIATTCFGDLIYLRPGPAESDKVYLTYHDSGQTEVLAESVDDLLAKLRRLNPDVAVDH